MMNNQGFKPAVNADFPVEDLVLDINHLNVGFFRNAVKEYLLQDINFAIAKGSRTALLGLSGAGKTILARAITGILPSGLHYFSGQLNFDGHVIDLCHDPDFSEIWGKKVSVVFQEAHAALNPLRKVGYQIQDVMQANPKLDKRQARQEALQWLENVGFEQPGKIFGKYPFQLSGGMAQRVNIVLALCGHPELLIADEPTSSIDVVNENEIAGLIEDLHNKLQFALILITHDASLARRLCTTEINIDNGRIISENSFASRKR